MLRLTTLRSAATVAVIGALTLAGCGGGGGSSHSMSSLVPSTTPGTGSSQSTNQKTTGTLSVVLPKTASSTSSVARAQLPSSGTRSPQYIDTTTANSALVVSVSPQDPAEAAQYGNLTLCYNLYTAGVLAPSNGTTFVVTTSGTNIAATVTIAIPSPPGTDGFQITQYAGQCGSTPYTVPTPPPGVTAGGILAQTPITYAYMIPGATNNLNIQIANCPTQPATGATPPPTFVCPSTDTTQVPATLAAAVTVANIAFGTIPIPSPIREQGAFIAAGSQVGVPIPLEALDAAGSVIPGLTVNTPSGLLLGSGPFPSGVTVSTTEIPATGTDTKLYLIDATNGAIAQTGATLSIHEFNILSGAAATGGNDITYPGSTAVAGDPWVIVLTSDGVDATKFTSVTVTATATIPPATTATTISTTITPQSAVFTATAPPNGYTDPTAVTAGSGILTASNGSTYVTDGNTLKIYNSPFVSAATGTKLTGLTFAQWPSPAVPTASFVYAVDQGSVGNTDNPAVSPSGLYQFAAGNPLTATPVLAQSGDGGYVNFGAPVGVAYGADSASGLYYVFVVDATGAIWVVDVTSNGAATNGYVIASNVVRLPVTGTALKPGTAPYVGTVTLPNGQFLVADPGNSRIALVAPSPTNSTVAISTYASGFAFTGISALSATNTPALYATSATGQIYYISGSGATPVSLGFATGTAVDGPVGQIPSLTPTAAQTFTPTNYPLQLQTGSFFSATAAPANTYSAPYTVAPFPNGSTGPVFSATPVGIALLPDTSAGMTTGPGIIDATGGILYTPPTATAAGVVTPDSLTFVDANGKLRTVVR